MNNVYRRYFSVTNESIVKIADSFNKDLKAYFGALNAIAKEYGAGETYYYNRDNRFAGFMFDDEPNMKEWKVTDRLKKCYAPRLSTKAGKELSKRIDAFTPPSDSAVYNALGFKSDRAFFSGMSFYLVQFIVLEDLKGSVKILLSVPWIDLDPEHINDPERKSDQTEHMKWTPGDGFEELKAWQFDKIIDEHNASVKSETV